MPFNNLTVDADLFPVGSVVNIVTEEGVARASVVQPGGGGGAPLSAEFWVDAAAPDGGNGSIGAPFNNLQTAHDSVPAGSALNLVPGTYGSLAMSNSLSLLAPAALGNDFESPTIIEGSITGLVPTNLDEVLTLTCENIQVTGNLSFDTGTDASWFINLFSCAVLGSTTATGTGLASLQAFGRYQEEMNFGGVVDLATGNSEFDANGATFNQDVSADGIFLTDSWSNSAITFTATGDIRVDDHSWNVMTQQGCTFVGPVFRETSAWVVRDVNYVVPNIAAGAVADVTVVVAEFAAAVDVGTHAGIVATWEDGSPPPANCGIVGAWLSNSATGAVTVRFSGHTGGVALVSKLLTLAQLQRKAAS